MPRRAQKQCIFCSNPANSKEHFWPEWMHDLLPQLPNPKHDRKIETYHPKEGRKGRGPVGRQGGLHTIRHRVVCEACNNGWMSKLEDQTRPLLTPLIEGTPVALDFDQMTVIARWIAMKCIVAEHSVPGTSVTPEHDRFAFRQDGVIPPYFHIYIANHNMPRAAGYVRHTQCLALRSPVPDPPLMGAAANVQTISFVLGRVCVHLNAARVRDYTLESRLIIPRFYQSCRIWPFLHHEVVWPHRPLLDQQGMSLIANTLAMILEAADLTWTDPA